MFISKEEKELFYEISSKNSSEIVLIKKELERLKELEKSNCKMITAAATDIFDIKEKLKGMSESVSIIKMNYVPMTLFSMRNGEKNQEIEKINKQLQIIFDTVTPEKIRNVLISAFEKKIEEETKKLSDLLNNIFNSDEEKNNKSTDPDEATTETQKEWYTIREAHEEIIKKVTQLKFRTLQNKIQDMKKNCVHFKCKNGPYIFDYEINESVKPNLISNNLVCYLCEYYINKFGVK